MGDILAVMSAHDCGFAHALELTAAKADTSAVNEHPGAVGRAEDGTSDRMSCAEKTFFEHRAVPDTASDGNGDEEASSLITPPRSKEPPQYSAQLAMASEASGTTLT